MKFRQDVQGLRAVAMLLVLVYHIWPEMVPMGYLGVDIFLVISGYLICSILGSQDVTSFKIISTFYFRRLRRILIPYLVVTFFFLIFSLFLVSPAEYPQIIWDTYTVIFYWANIAPVFLTEGYFTLLHRWKFLLHLWSVCLELQFYLIAPLFVILFTKLTKIYRATCLSILIIVSFSFQIYSAEAVSHGFLHCRLWQFLCGFAIHFYEGKASPYQPMIYNMSLMGIILINIFPVPITSVFNRVIVTILTSILIRSNYQHGILSNEAIGYIGNVSYTIYLVHWTWISVFKYWFANEMEENTVIFGMYLLMSSMVIGALMDEAFSKILQKITKWWQLIISIGALYTFILLLTYYLSSSNIVKISTHTFDKSNIPHYQALPFNLYEQSIDLLKDTNTVQEENAIMEIFTFLDVQCDDKRKWFDTKEDVVGLEEIEFICHDKGRGTKSILAIGNSHSAVLYNGIRYHFKDVYSELALISVVYCMPFLSHLETRNRERCIQHQNQMRKMIETSYTRYDVIIVAIQYNEFLNANFTKSNIFEDYYYQQIMEFTQFLNAQATELVLLPRVHVQFPDKSLYFTLQRQIFTNREFTSGVVERHIIDNHLPNLQQRLRHVNCSKCMFVDWRNAVCDWERCYAVNEKTNNIIFYDYTHVNVLGSLYYGKMVRDMYDYFLETGKRDIEDQYKKRRLPFSRF